MSSSNADSATSQRHISNSANEGSKHAKDIAIDQVKTAANIGTEAVTSGTYFYPIEVLHCIP